MTPIKDLSNISFDINLLKPKFNEEAKDLSFVTYNNDDINNNNKNTKKLNKSYNNLEQTQTNESLLDLNNSFKSNVFINDYNLSSKIRKIKRLSLKGNALENSLNNKSSDLILDKASFIKEDLNKAYVSEAKTSLIKASLIKRFKSSFKYFANNNDNNDKDNNEKEIKEFLNQNVFDNNNNNKQSVFDKDDTNKYEVKLREDYKSRLKRLNKNVKENSVSLFEFKTKKIEKRNILNKNMFINFKSNNIQKLKLEDKSIISNNNNNNNNNIKESIFLSINNNFSKKSFICYF